MQLPEMEHAVLLQRYKRFLADVRRPSGERVTVYCPNPGSMLSCNAPGSPVLLSRQDAPGRKLPWTWELIFTNNVWVGVNPMRSNALVREAIVNKQITGLDEYDTVQTEVPYGQNSRIDILLSHCNRLCYVEVKNVTLAQDRIARFPDAVTKRGTKHLHELTEMVRQGHRAVMFYLVQRADAESFRPAALIDPVYAQTLNMAFNQGVEILVYNADITPQHIVVNKQLPFRLTD
ncbi:MAG TPA: DNA/RNA nuclease SfsA [bacterium]|nr:DNA/RNA nuclease SfsA [bacterium]HPN45245.1 DNA/RNA nuclease SfsA [bacterium]